MKILMVNKFYYIKGGSETYYFSLKRLLEAKGHEVIDFSMKSDENFVSPYGDYFVDHVDYNSGSGILPKLKAAANIVYSREAKDKFTRLVERTKPDLVHLHIFQHQISPSILDVIKEKHLPVVYTAHDLKLVCLNYKMMHHGQICELCKQGRYYHCVRQRCVKDSLMKSGVNLIEGYFHKWRRSYDVISCIITPSAFYKQKITEFGISGERIFHIPNFLDTEKPDVEKQENYESYYLYLGRLSEEKGIFTMIRAFSDLSLPLFVVGNGPLLKPVTDAVNASGLNNIALLGFKTGPELKTLIGNAKALILPSEWYENGPYSAIEALQLGIPVIGADIGGIPELVDGNGLLFESGNAEDLKARLLDFENLGADAYRKQKERSEQIYQQYYTAKSHYLQLERVYQSAVCSANENGIMEDL